MQAPGARPGPCRHRVWRLARGETCIATAARASPPPCAARRAALFPPDRMAWHCLERPGCAAWAVAPSPHAANCAPFRARLARTHRRALAFRGRARKAAGAVAERGSAATRDADPRSWAAPRPPWAPLSGGTLPPWSTRREAAQHRPRLEKGGAPGEAPRLATQAVTVAGGAVVRRKQPARATGQRPRAHARARCARLRGSPPGGCGALLTPSVWGGFPELCVAACARNPPS